MPLLFRSVISVVLAFMVFTQAWGGELAGLWQEYDDDSGSLVALIRIEQLPDNSYEGRIEKVFLDRDENPAPICRQCPGELRNQPLQGLRILSGMKRKDKLSFEGGRILDPDDGKTYQCRLRLSEDGNTVEVTGYLNLNWIGQSEIWRRISK